MSSIEPGDWMESKTTGAFLEVLEVSADGNVGVRMDGKLANTTKQYLLAQYVHLGDGAA